MNRLGLCIVASVAMACSLVADIHLDADQASKWGSFAGWAIAVCAVLWFMCGDER